jgi:hypothetical protein
LQDEEVARLIGKNKVARQAVGSASTDDGREDQANARKRIINDQIRRFDQNRGAVDPETGEFLGVNPPPRRGSAGSIGKSLKRWADIPTSPDYNPDNDPQWQPAFPPESPMSIEQQIANRRGLDTANPLVQGTMYPRGNPIHLSPVAMRSALLAAAAVAAAGGRAVTGNLGA